MFRNVDQATWESWFLFRPHRVLCWGLATAMIAAGTSCAGRSSSTDLLEARLRDRERELREVQRERDDVRQQLAQTVREAESDRVRLASHQSGDKRLPEAESTQARIVGIKLNSWLTGALDSDNDGRDDRLTLLLIPHDASGELVKQAGQVTANAVDPSSEDGRSVGRWTFSLDEVQAAWYRGVLGSGYQLSGSLTNLAGVNEIAVHVAYRLPDGREFRTTQLVKIRRESTEETDR